MKLPRTSSEQQRRALKIAAGRLIALCGGQESAAMITRVGQQALSDYANTNNARHADTHMPLDVALDLTLDRNEISPVVATLCRLAGGAFVALPAGLDAGLEAGAGANVGRAIAQDLARAVREGGEAAGALCEALADDGRVSPREIVSFGIAEKLSAAIEALCALKAHCERVLDGEGRR